MSAINQLVKLHKIDKECEQNPLLKKRLEPIISKMITPNQSKKRLKQNARIIISEYKKAKKELRL